ncbi:MAG: tRNA (N(6)-L-threonylcarbamoyladenosine(37)-C(2))-methylthiotransferase [Candidatus Aenigmatarchaeota archaeon]
MKVYIETYGCSANRSDSEIMMALLKKEGFEIVESPEFSDINIINTCIVKTPTANRMLSRISFLYNLAKPLIIAGCMSKAEREQLEKKFPKASLISPEAIDKIVDVAKMTLDGKKIIALEGFAEKPKLPFIPFNPIISIVQISIGCLSYCSFCETKIAKGNLKSYRPLSIIEKIELDLKNGFKEFWITSQDNACYGFDIGTNLGELLLAIKKIEGKFYVRVGMMNPFHLIRNQDLLNKIIEALKDDKFYKFVHLPLQSGSNKVLKDMNRLYTVEEYKKIIENFRKEIPDIRIETDIIVGYPTESEKDFEESVKIVKELKFDSINISKFSSRPNTPASKLKELDVEIVKKRSKIISEVALEVLYKNKLSFLNKELKVFVDEIGVKPNTYVGRTMNYTPVVIKTEKNIFGKEVLVRIKEAKSHYLIADFIDLL